MQELQKPEALLIKSHLYKLYKKLTVETSIDLHDSYIAGGCIASLIQNETPKDYDFFFHNEKDFNHIIDQIKKLGLETTYELYKTKAAHTLKIGDNKIQFISKRYGPPRVILDEFDFYHTRSYYNCSASLLFISNIAYECAKKKILLFNNIKDTSIQRSIRFIERGYKLPIDQFNLLKVEFGENELSNKFCNANIMYDDQKECFVRWDKGLKIAA